MIDVKNREPQNINQGMLNLEGKNVIIQNSLFDIQIRESAREPGTSLPLSLTDNQRQFLSSFSPPDRYSYIGASFYSAPPCWRQKL